MKCITLIIHASTKGALTDLFHEIPQVERFTISDCEGYDENDLKNSLVSTGDLVLGYVPRVRIEVILEDSLIEAVLKAVREPTRGLAGLGIYWITPVESEGSL